MLTSLCFFFSSETGAQRFGFRFKYLTLMFLWGKLVYDSKSDRKDYSYLNCSPIMAIYFAGESWEWEVLWAFRLASVKWAHVPLLIQFLEGPTGISYWNYLPSGTLHPHWYSTVTFVVTTAHSKLSQTEANTLLSSTFSFQQAPTLLMLIRDVLTNT